MRERFDRATSAKVRRAAQLAGAEGSAVVEADHLLLAIVDPVDDAIGDALARMGLTADAIRSARDRTFRSSLQRIGIETTRPAPRGSSRLRRGRTTRFAQSAKLALERTVRHSQDNHVRDITTEHLLIGILAAEVGRTPRLLAELSTTADELLAKIHAPTS